MKLLFILFISISLYSKDLKIDEDRDLNIKNNSFFDDSAIRLLCINWYKYIAVIQGNGGLSQMLENDENKGLVAIKCENKEYKWK